MSVDAELSLPIEDEIHFIVVIVEVVARSAMRVEDSTVEEIQVRLKRVFGEEGCVINAAGASMNCLRYFELAWIGVHKPLRERLKSK
jgi:hypothetical protein